MADFFNDGGVPHGGFIAQFSHAGFVKLEAFNPEDPGKVINRPDEVGAPNGWAGVQDQETATATAQIPDNTGSALILGDYFNADAAHGGAKWVVVGMGTRFQMGNYWQQEVRLQKAYFN